MDFKAIVVGGGHAGIEACLALSRLGFSTLLITQNIEAIGALSCNPAIGGLSKGNIVREIDALGGEMARLIDKTMIQYRILNRSRGPAVQAPRAQADKHAYSRLARQTLEKQSHLYLFQDTVIDIMTDDSEKQILGVETERGRKFTAETVVLTTGTFMEGRIFIGPVVQPFGRIGEPAALGLGTNLRRRGFDLRRLKTGTPARVARRSLDFSRMEEQPGDNPAEPFSFFGGPLSRKADTSCYITYTNEKTHQIIRKNMDKSPLYGGKITGTGPRYCPSIEDKVVRFPDRQRHQVFVEPESLETTQMYLNGISSSLPEEVQEDFLRTLPGLENLEIIKPGYAVEYDFVYPLELYPSLETKKVQGLFLAGQTNGTSGYEEAGGQGLLAGINAAMFLQKKAPLILSRAEAYMGVLIDDLVTLGTEEPYRMFTSRAEHRLSLRHDTADRRLFLKGLAAGLHNPEREEIFRQKQQQIDEIKELLRQNKAGEKNSSGLDLFAPHLGKDLYHCLKDPKITLKEMESLISLENYSSAVKRQVELDIKYEGYISRQEKIIQRFNKLEKMRIPAEFDYQAVSALTVEAREKLSKVKPLSLGQASRISGIRNSDISVLMVLLNKKQAKHD